MFLIEFNYDLCAVSVSQDGGSTILTLTADNTVDRSVRDCKVRNVVYKATGFTSFYAAVKNVSFNEDPKIDSAVKQQIIAFDDFCCLPK